MCAEQEKIEIEKLISASILRIRLKSPFFATLALYAKYKPETRIPTCATDGIDIFYNPTFFKSLPKRQLDGAIVHEILHAALFHAKRRNTRDPQLWNIAGDVVVNGIIAKQDFLELIPDHIRMKDLEDKKVEEIYEILLQKEEKAQQQNNANNGNEDNDRNDIESNESGQNSKNVNSSNNSKKSKKGSSKEREQIQKSPCFHEVDKGDPSASDAEGSLDFPVPSQDGKITDIKAMEEAKKAKWKEALRQAEVIQRTTQKGNMPAGWEVIEKYINDSTFDWRILLWQFLVKTPADFDRFDRRFLHQGLYLEELTGEKVKVFICVDTSGSINSEDLGQFLAEIRAILNTYPHLEAQLYFADCSVHGPYDINKHETLPKPVGGGGTSFIPFFEKIEKEVSFHESAVALYFTDGYGDFPKPENVNVPTLWLVSIGGEDSTKFPFGQVCTFFKNKY